MNIEEAKALLTPQAVENLHSIVDVRPTIDFSKKVNNDILMTALCKAVNDGVIKDTSLTDRLVKLLNSETNTISQSKLQEILEIVHKKQPYVRCVIRFEDVIEDMQIRLVSERVYKDGEITFNSLFEDVLIYYHISPSDIRQKMTETLKATIVNNISQLVSKYYKSTEEEQQKMVISISTINRLVNMSGGILTAEFEDNE